MYLHDRNVKHERMFSADATDISGCLSSLSSSCGHAFRRKRDPVGWMPNDTSHHITSPNKTTIAASPQAKLAALDPSAGFSQIYHVKTVPNWTTGADRTRGNPALSI
jgi:hypothetical protein